MDFNVYYARSRSDKLQTTYFYEQKIGHVYQKDCCITHVSFKTLILKRHGLKWRTQIRALCSRFENPFRLLTIAVKHGFHIPYLFIGVACDL